jgi:heat shock protein HslJ
MKERKKAIIGLCMLMITVSFCDVIATAEDSATGTSNAGGGTSSAGIWYPTMGRMTYNEGNARGTFVHFKIDENTGTISDYTVKLTFYPNVWYSPISSIQPFPEKEFNSSNITYENKTIFNSIQINGFEPVGTPNAFADYLIFQGKNTLMRFFDTEGGSMNYASSDKNTTITFEVPDGFEISQFPDDIYYALPVTVTDGKEGDSNTGISDQSIEIVGEWTLVSYGNATNSTHAMQGVDTFIQFDADGKFNGNVGCNSFGGNYNLSDDKISFDSISSTEMYCDKTDNQEQGVLSVLSQPDLKFQLNNDTLAITNGIYVLTLEKGGITIINSGSDLVPSPWQTIWIKSDNTTTSINSYNGTVTIDGQTIEIELSAYGYLDIYTYVEYPAPPVVNDFWYNDLNITQGQSIIENAKNNGTITAEGWYTKSDLQPPTAEISNQASNQIIQGDVTSNYYTYDDPTFQMTFNNVNKTGVDVVVNSQIPNGRIVIINVDKELLQTTSVEKLLVSFDSTVINPTGTLESLMEKVQNKDTNASYYALTGEQLTTVFVYVPHFSMHTISIESLASGIAAVTNVLLPIILSVLFICIIIGGIIVNKRKQQDDF